MSKSTTGACDVPDFSGMSEAQWQEHLTELRRHNENAARFKKWVLMPAVYLFAALMLLSEFADKDIIQHAFGP